jgi:nucleotide-binding universal stress UspA family protein
MERSAMTTILVPCDGSGNSLLGVQHAVSEYREGTAVRIHLLNVQPTMPSHIAHHVGREVLVDFQRERADEALAPARRVLDAAGVPYSVHVATGARAECIAEAATRLACDRIVMGTARKSALLRAVENSLTDKLIECTHVPVELIAGARASALERVGIPAGVGAGLAILWLGAA